MIRRVALPRRGLRDATSHVVHAPPTSSKSFPKAAPQGDKPQAHAEPTTTGVPYPRHGYAPPTYARHPHDASGLIRASLDVVALFVPQEGYHGPSLNLLRGCLLTQLQTRASRPGASAARAPVRSVAPCRAASVARCLTHSLRKTRTLDNACLEGGTTPATLGGTSSSLVMVPTLGRQASQVGRVSEPQRQPPGRLGCGLATVWSARSGSCSWRCRDGRA